MSAQDQATASDGPVAVRAATTFELVDRADPEFERLRLQAMAGRLAAIVQDSDDGIYTKTLDGRIAEWNPGAARLYGYSREEILGLPIHTVVPPDKVEEEIDILRRIAAGERLPPFETVRVRKDGTRIDVSLTVSPVRDPDGRIVGASAIARDVTARRRVEAALRMSEQHYRFLADAVPVQVWTASADGRVDYANARLLAYYGKEADQLLGEGWQSGLHPEDLGACLQQWAKSVQTGDPFSVEFRLRRHDGEYRWHMAQALPLKDSGGHVLEWFGSNTDIHDHKETQRVLSQRAQQLAELAEALERTNRELDQFAYVTSHDLKAPLRGIANLSRWIEEDLGEVPEEARRNFELLRGRVQRMESLIDAILEYSRAGRATAKAEPVDTGALLAEVVDLLAPPPGFRVDIAPGMPVVVAPRTRLSQVFLNLVANAVKHHDRSEGVVAVLWEDADRFWRFSVADDGPGIPERFHEKLFVIFQTLQARDKREGTGIGLALVKKIVESHGGAVSVESEGRGTTFRFTWPKERNA